MNDTLIHYIIELIIALVAGLYIFKLTKQSDKTDKSIEDAKLVATRLAVIESKIDAIDSKGLTNLESKVAVIESRLDNEIHLLEKLDNKLDRLIDDS